MNINRIIDGTSNTIFYTEGLAVCKRVENTVYSKYTYDLSYTYNRIWNYDSYYTRSDVVHTLTGTTYTLIFTSDIAPTVSARGWYDPSAKKTYPFQLRPSAKECDVGSAQATTSGGLLVALGDGSVRTLSPRISLSTWYAAMTSRGNEVLGSDW
jgi:hypothetical protein